MKDVPKHEQTREYAGCQRVLGHKGGIRTHNLRVMKPGEMPLLYLAFDSCCGRLTASALDAIGQRVAGVGIEVGAQFVGGHAVFEEVGDRQHHLGRRHLIRIRAVQPFVDVGLADFRIRNVLANAAS